MNIDDQIEEARVRVIKAERAIDNNEGDKYKLEKCLDTYKEAMDLKKQSLALTVPAGKNVFLCCRGSF